MKTQTASRRADKHLGVSSTTASKGKLWRHPRHRSIRVPRKAAAAIAVMEMGIADYDTIAGAVGLTVEEIAQIDRAEDTAIRQLGIARIPYGVYFHLQDKVRCPRCDAWITLAPCVACDCRKNPEVAEEAE